MNKIATITSKRQLTIPATFFRKSGFRDRQKVLITETDGKLVISQVDDLVNALAGSLQSPKKWQGKNIDKIIELSKQEYFSDKK